MMYRESERETKGWLSSPLLPLGYFITREISCSGANGMSSSGESHLSSEKLNSSIAGAFLSGTCCSFPSTLPKEYFGFVGSQRSDPPKWRPTLRTISSSRAQCRDDGQWACIDYRTRAASTTWRVSRRSKLEDAASGSQASTSFEHP
ncbi:hypothetical protein AAHA92_04709 [Salvia divinorum]|uniref:Uncharacterized protein n=1 Tax=Salvia divinorum TaxID=28513 RepID=A0ABD1I461_SALDI